MFKIKRGVGPANESSGGCDQISYRGSVIACFSSHMREEDKMSTEKSKFDGR